MADVPEQSGQHEESGFSFRRPEGLLAHYTKASTVFEHILPTGRLRLSPYSAMRDPIENRDFVPAMTVRTDDVPDSQFEAAAAATMRLLTALRGMARVLSFTHDAGIDPGLGTAGCCWARPRMWEQYGDVHRGACLVFDRERLVSALDERLQELGSPPYLREVTYSPQGIADTPARTLSDQRILDDEQRSAAVVEFVENRHADLYFHKSDDFLTEHEFRAVVLTHSDIVEASVDFRPSLVAIVLGEKVPSWQVMGALGECKDRGIELRKMSWFNAYRWARLIGGGPTDR